MRWQATERWYRNLIAQKLGIPVVGNVFFVAPVNTQYDSWFRREMDVPSELMFTTPALAYAAATSAKNDVIMVAPGAYVTTAELAWAKTNTHMIGLTGPNNGGDYGDDSGVNIYSTTTTVANIINLTGKTCQFHGIGLQNNGANAACLSALKLDAVGAYFKDCNIMGCMAATQSATALACSLWIRGGGMYPIFENCNIGHSVWTTRSGANQGVILFNESNTQANGGQFNHCNILSTCATATGNFVAVVGNNVVGRGWTFRDCVFDNYTASTRMNQAFYMSASNSVYDRAILLKDCILNTKGCDAWQDQDYGNIYGNQPATASTGGLVAEISE